MSEAAAGPRKHRRLVISLVIGVTLIVLVVGAAFYLRSEHFKQVVRQKVISGLEQATGGQVELHSVEWNLSQLRFAAGNLTIHGTEAQGEAPFLFVEHVEGKLRITSAVGARVRLQSLQITRPAVHIIVYPDGSTNAPPVKQPSQPGNPVQQLFDLAVRQAEVTNGVLQINDRKLPLDFSVSDLHATMSYDRPVQRYDGAVQVGRMNAQYANWREVAATLDAAFSLWRNAAELKKLQLTSENSSLQLSGKLINFNHPEINATYSTSFDLQQTGAVIRDYHLRAGTLTLDGSAQCVPSECKSSGKLAVRRLDYVDEGLTARNAGLDSEFALDHDNLSLKRIVARVLGGEVTGDVEVKNYLQLASEKPATTAAQRKSETKQRAAANAKARPAEAVALKGPGPQEGVAYLEVRHISLAETARMAATKDLPLERLKAVGTIQGRVEARWIGSPARALVDAALTASAVQPASGDMLPVNGSLHGRYDVRTEVWDFSELNLRTPHTQLNTSGTMGTRTAQLKLGVETSSLAEFAPLLSAMGSSPLPVDLHGNASFHGTLSGNLKSPNIDGRLQAADFTYTYTPTQHVTVPVVAHAPAARDHSWFHRTPTGPPVGSHPEAASDSTQQAVTAQPVSVHIDSFEGDVQYSTSDIALQHAVIRQDETVVNVDGSAGLQNGTFTDDSQFQVSASMHGARIADLQKVAGTSYPVSGLVSFALHASGTKAHPTGHGTFALTGAEAYGRPITALTSNVALADQEVQLDDIHLQAAHGAVQGTAAYNLSSTAFRFDLRGSDVELASFPELQWQRLSTAGNASFRAQGSGTRETPVINAHLEVANFTLNQERVGTLIADAQTHGTQLELVARAEFPKAKLQLDGSVQLRDQFASNFNLQFADVAIDPFLSTEIKTRLTAQSGISGQGHVSGPLKQPRMLSGNLKVAQFHVEVDRIPIQSDGEIDLSLANEVIRIDRLQLISQASHLTASGAVDLRNDRPLNLALNGHIDLKLIQTFDADITAYGSTDIALTMSGPVSDPVIGGRVTISHGGLSLVDFPAGLGDVNGTLVFNHDRLEVEQLTGRVGGGLVKFGGFAKFDKNVTFEMTADGNDIRFRYSGISVTADQTLRLAGSLQSSTLSGDITVTRFAQIPSEDFISGLTRSSQPEQIPNPDSPLNNLHFDMHILSTPELTVQTSMAKLSGDVDLRVRGTAARPVLLGRINVVEGDVNVNGQKFELERGDITFSNLVRIEPVLDIEAKTRVRDYDITIGLHGTPDKLNTTYRSDPPLSSDDIIALLAFGQTQEERAMGAPTTATGVGAGASGVLLGEAINRTVTNRVSKLFGVSSIRINPALGGGPDNNPNARLTVEQQVSSNVTITYTTNLAQSAQQVVQFDYNINSEYTLQGIRDENGVVSFDLLIRKRKK